MQQDFKSLDGLVAGIGKEEIMAKFSFHCQCYKSGQLGGLSAKEYKKKMEEENKELNNRLDKLTVEYNNLVDEYNGLVKDKKTLEKNNKQKAYEIIERQERKR